MRPGCGRYLGLAGLLACGAPPDRRAEEADSSGGVLPADSLVLTTSAGTEIWFTLARPAASANGTRCTERGLEIRQGGRRIKVPLLYTGTPPVVVNDSTMRAVLWTHCQPGDAYLVSLRSGQPVPENRARP